MPFVLLTSLALLAACDKVPLLAPTGTVITILPTANTVALNSQITIVATVIENGVASAGTGGAGSGSSSGRAGNGTPVQNGTVVNFTTTIGRIEPAEARTHDGQVTVQLITDSTSGLATITAYSGGASAQFPNLKVGTAAAKTVTLAAAPATLGSSGGSTKVTATVTDDQGGPVSGIPVTFSTDNGTLTPPTATTDTDGNAVTTLTTTKTAKVTASAGTATTGAAPLTVTVNPFGLSGFSAANGGATTTGVPLVFTVTPATGANISNVHVTFGDGRSTDLGPISAATSVSNSYCSAGNYTAIATVSDAAGGTGQLSTTVIIGALPVTLASSGTATVASPLTFTAGGITGAQISHYEWTFDDGTGSQTTSAPQISHTFGSNGIKNVRVDVFGVSGCQIGTATLTLAVQ